MISKPPFVIYTSGKTFKFLIDEKNEPNLPHFTPISKITNQQQVKKIVSGIRWNLNCLVWKGKNQLELYQSKGWQEPNDFTLKKYLIKNEIIKDIQAGQRTYLILTQSGKVYSLADSKKGTHCEIPLADPEKSNLDEIRPVPFFNDIENNRKVKSIAMTGWSCYYLCHDHKLYGNGLNGGRLGDQTSNKSKHIPVLIYENVTRIFSSIQAYGLFITTNKNDLYSCGYNSNGILGIGNIKDQNSLQKVPNWKNKANDILNICSCNNFTVLVTKLEGKTFSCGDGKFNGIGKNKLKFALIPSLKGKKVIQLSGGQMHCLILTKGNELYGWGFTNRRYNENEYNHPTDQYQNESENWFLPRKINLPQFYVENENKFNLKIHCGTNSVILYPEYIDCLVDDFKKLFESKKFCDSKIILLSKTKNRNKKEINIEVQIHKLIVELRTGLKINQINNLLNQNFVNQKEINFFLKWVYYEKISNEIILNRIFNTLNLPFPPKNSLKKDILKLFQDEDSKDFLILVKENDENEKGEEEEEEDGISVHKLILLARSGLYREMFQNINEKEQNLKHIKDYSGKSIESLEILITYLYTNSIKFTADHDPQLIIEELQDAVEYYQLNESSNFLTQLMNK
ncbi:regulator of chromosome condensation [Anaeramoeba flamelloides]|uniref:Regulator of chromosome condensation n=1 Tax=Anaeramoeba flamelloides TaxID=1746091 RepID=A0AAV8AF97_9EUKA|nr:regulator of chromosome condensation [Anaeramoeba flamelloides]